MGNAVAISLAALARAIRWGIAASTVDPVVLTLLQLLHGLTFALPSPACAGLPDAFPRACPQPRKRSTAPCRWHRRRACHRCVWMAVRTLGPAGVRCHQPVVPCATAGWYEEEFLGFSYGFRPGRSQHGCWRISKRFASIPRLG